MKNNSELSAMILPFLMEVYNKCKDVWISMSPGTLALLSKIPYHTCITKSMIKKGFLLRQPDGHGHFQYKWNKEEPTIETAKILLKKICSDRHNGRIKKVPEFKISQAGTNGGFETIQATIEQLRKIGATGVVVIPEMRVTL